MIGGPESSVALRPVSPEEIRSGLAAALAGGPPIAPLPNPGAELSRTVAMLDVDRPVTEPDAAVVIATSGSTGAPKGVVLSRAAIAASVTATHARLGGPGDWVLALPSHYVAGLMVLARCILDGTVPHTVPANLTGLARLTDEMSGRRYISLVPTQLIRALADPKTTGALTRFDAVLLGGAAAEPRMMAEARNHGIHVVTTYGMSETCGGCVYDGIPLDRVDVEVEPGSGRILLRGPMLFSGYRLRPDLTAAALKAGAYLTPDRGIKKDGRLSALGRLDAVVISGGVNVDLDEVERAARTWPGRDGADVIVVGVPDAQWGTIVVAVTDGTGSEPELRDFLGQTVPWYAVPRRLEHVGALPRTPGGKIDRRRLVADLTAASTVHQEVLSP